MRIHAYIVCQLAFSLLALIAAAASGADDPATAIAPFVNEQTLAAGRIDLTRVDFDSLNRWVDDALIQSKLSDADRAEMSAQLRRGTTEGQQWVEQFKKAGGKTLWVVFTLETFPRSAPVFFAVPLGPNADAEALTKLFGGNRPPAAPGQPPAQSIERIHDALVGTPDVGGLDIIKALRPKDRPDLAKALAESGDAPLSIALVPTADARNVIESMAPPLPEAQSITALTRGLVWAAAGVRFPPDASAHAVIQSANHDSAEAMQNLLKSILRASREQNPKMSADPIEMKIFGPAVAAAMGIADRSRVEDDRVRVDLDSKDLGAVMARLAMAARSMHDNANRAVSANRERQLLLACAMYADKQRPGEFPDALEEAVKAADVGAADLLVNPRHPDRKPGYAYIKPPEGVKVPPDRMVVYEAGDDFGDGINIGFADGHVEWVADEATFKKLLQAAQDAKKVPPADGAPGERK